MVKTKKKKFKQKRKAWFRGLKGIARIRYNKPNFVYLGEKPSKGSIILSNHEGTDAPMRLELYCDFPIRMWGAHEMNSGLKELYKYQSKVYYHEKKGWNIHLARAFCLLAAPPTNLFYKGLNLISTYKDVRLKDSIRESIEFLKEGDNIVIFPENSDEGYLKQLKDFLPGFVLLAKESLRSGYDAPIFTAYYNKETNTYVFDKPILYSVLKEKYKTKDEMCKYLVDNCNKLESIKAENRKNNY